MRTDVEKHVARGIRAQLAHTERQLIAAVGQIGALRAQLMSAESVIGEMVQELGGTGSCAYATDVARRARNTMQSQREEIDRLRDELASVKSLLAAQQANQLSILRMAIARATEDRSTLDPYVDTHRALAKIVEERDGSLRGLREVALNLGLDGAWQKDPCRLTVEIQDRILDLRRGTPMRSTDATTRTKIVDSQRCGSSLCSASHDWVKFVVAWTGIARLECTKCGWKKYLGEWNGHS